MNKYMNFYIFLLTLFFFFRSHVLSIELQTVDVAVIKVGVVDMNKILANYPKTQQIQQELSLLRQNKLAELSNIETELQNLQKQTISLNMEMQIIQQQILNIGSEMSVSTSSFNIEQSTDTQTLTTVNEKKEKLAQMKDDLNKKQINLEQINKSIDEKKRQIETQKNKIEKEIQEKKEKYEIELYAELYKIIQEIAQKENLNIIIDKSGILYGEPQIDITEKVLNTLNR